MTISFYRRALWHANRTSLAWVLKGLVSLLNRREKSLRRAMARSMSSGASTSRLTEELKHKGYATITDIVEPALLAEMVGASRIRVSHVETLSAKQLHGHKSFWVRLLDADLQDGQFPADNIYVRFATQPSIVGLLSSYLGEMPQLVDVLLTLSRDSDDSLKYSQLWHKDYDDVRTIKVFTYLTDVRDTRDGPFMLLPRAASDRIGFTFKSHLPDELVFSRAKRAEVHEICGMQRTTFVCETSRCLHAGSRLAPGHSRLMYTATFISAPSVYPSSGTRFRAAYPLKEYERLVLGL